MLPLLHAQAQRLGQGDPKCPEQAAPKPFAEPASSTALGPSVYAGALSTSRVRTQVRPVWETGQAEDLRQGHAWDLISQVMALPPLDKLPQSHVAGREGGW